MLQLYQVLEHCKLNFHYTSGNKFELFLISRKIAETGHLLGINVAHRLCLKIIRILVFSATSNKNSAVNPVFTMYPSISPEIKHSDNLSHCCHMLLIILMDFPLYWKILRRYFVHVSFSTCKFPIPKNKNFWVFIHFKYIKNDSS